MDFFIYDNVPRTNHEEGDDDDDADDGREGRDGSVPSVRPSFFNSIVGFEATDGRDGGWDKSRAVP